MGSLVRFTLKKKKKHHFLDLHDREKRASVGIIRFVGRATDREGAGVSDAASVRHVQSTTAAV